MSISSVVDVTGVAVITGGASGFGIAMAERLVKAGMHVAVLDISDQEMAVAKQRLQAVASDERRVLMVHCDVSKFEQCREAQQAVDAAFRDMRISFLFNNAGILGAKDVGQIITGDPDKWTSVFAVNVFGAVNIIKAFLPAMIDGGPLPSGKRSFVVTTSSVAGLLNHNLGPYPVSKMAVTAVCEQLCLELDGLGSRAAHISAHSLHPSLAGTQFLTGRDMDGSKTREADFVQQMLKAGMTSAEDVIDGLFEGLAAGKHYVVVDNPLDIPTSKQVAMRMEDQMSGSRPRKPEQLAYVLLMSDQKAFNARLKQMKKPKSSL